MAPMSAEFVTVFLALLFDGFEVVKHRPSVISNDADAGQCSGIVLDADCFVIRNLKTFHEGPDVFYCSGFVMKAMVGPGILIAIGSDTDNAEFTCFTSDNV
jgi:hypothetical protein